MRTPGAARLAAVLLLSSGLLVGCGSDEPEADATDAPVTTTPTVAEPGEKIECPEREVFAAFTVNAQLASQYPEVEPGEWGQGLGTMDAFGEQIKALQVLTGDEVQANLALFAQADEIIQRGIGGDPDAGADLKALLGTDVGVTLQKKIPISLAYGQQCP